MSSWIEQTEAMFMSGITRVFLVIFFGLILGSCQKDGAGRPTNAVWKPFVNLPDSAYNYSNLSLPDFFQNQFVRIQDNTPTTNPVTNWGATLGRVLFYDKQLSLNGKIACASCHVQAFGFTDTAQFSKGFEGGLTTRHSMALVNAKYYQNGRFFWDERAATLEEQVLMPIQDPVEMGMTLDKVVARLSSSPFYPALFEKAFGSTGITADKVSKALAQFVRSLVSYQSKYDVGRSLVDNRLKDFPNFDPTENLGKAIFMTHPQIACFGCHNTDVFIADNPRNNGSLFENTDQGIFTHTKQALDIGKFKTPSLKNVAVRGRYMHLGQLKGLDEVIDFYDANIQPNANLDLHLKGLNGLPLQMKLSDTEKIALKAFLETLTDHVLIKDEKFSNPFR